MKSPKAILTERLAHQQREVDEARAKIGQPGYTAAYLRRMIANCQQTKRYLRKYAAMEKYVDSFFKKKK